MSCSPPPSVPGSQVIVRPPVTRPGGPPPWAALPPWDRRPIRLQQVVTAMGRRGDTRNASGEGQPAPGFGDPHHAQFVATRPSAVLVALFEEDGEARVVLTVRSSWMRSHRGEVALPGGRLDQGETVEEAALREAFEEVGLDPASATRLGFLTSMPTVSSNTLMTPMVAVLASRPTLVAAPEEVARVFDVALSDLAADGVFHEERWLLPGRDPNFGADVPVWFFEAGGEIIWGATARVLTELLCVVLDLQGPGRRQ